MKWKVIHPCSHTNRENLNSGLRTPKPMLFPMIFSMKRKLAFPQLTWGGGDPGIQLSTHFSGLIPGSNRELKHCKLRERNPPARAEWLLFPPVYGACRKMSVEPSLSSVCRMVLDQKRLGDEWWTAGGWGKGGLECFGEERELWTKKKTSRKEIKGGEQKEVGLKICLPESHKRWHHQP